MVAGKSFDTVSDTRSLDFEKRVATLYAECFGLIGNCDCTSVVVAKYNDGFVTNGRIEHPFTRYKEIVAVNQSYHGA